MDDFNNNGFNTNENGGGNQFEEQGAQQNPYAYQQQTGQPGQCGQPQQTQQYGGVDPYNQSAQNQPYNMPPQNGQYQQNYSYNQQGIPQNGYIPPQAGMPYQGYGMPYQQPSTGMATASLVLGIISICSGLFMYVFPVLFLLPIIGMILGIVFKSKRLPVGKGISTAGIITSVIGLLLPIVFVVIIYLNMDSLLQILRDENPEMYQQYYEMFGEQFPEWFDGILMMFR
ncbi:MAG: DUF4190 domain-containing protein [Oscillospiraceae bacterium]|nr:DUF4190 domain-containing protein [Oscillospiraceae bacterium]